MRMTIVRHGETDWNAISRIQGQQDVALNYRGIQQAQAAATHLAGQHFDALYSSDLKRAYDSAIPLSKIINLPVQTTPSIREWKLGILEGLLRTEAEQQYPDIYPIYDQQHPDSLIPQGETIRQRHQRACQWLEDKSLQHQNQHILVITHGGILDDWYRHVKNIPLETSRDWLLNNAGISQFEKTNGQWKLLIWSEISHLKNIGSMGHW